MSQYIRTSISLSSYVCRVVRPNLGKTEISHGLHHEFWHFMFVVRSYLILAVVG